MILPSDSLAFRNSNSDRISSNGRIRLDTIGPGIGFLDLGSYNGQIEELDQ
jgi:hypothetical protein